MDIPKEVKEIINKLEREGFEAYIVGGCVRDFLRNKEPEDWDITTNATPSEIQRIFPRSFYNNKFFTVTVLTKSQNPKLKEIEVTTFRKEGKYYDKRHPSKISFAKSLEEDLKRRDFTINAMAMRVKEELFLIDPFSGKKDLERKIIRAVGKPEKRFSEDALRMMRAVRLAVSLGKGWKIEKETEKAIKENAFLIKEISKERIRDEFIKIIISERAVEGVELLRKLRLLKHFLPELEEGYKVTQNKHHIYDCYEHALRSLDFAVKRNFSLEVRLSALFHDIGKPRTKRGEGPNATFYGHEVVGAKMTKEILERLRFPKKQIEKIVKLVRYHLFYYNVGEVTESAVRRLIRKVGLENIDDLIKLRMADRVGSGCKKAEPYKLRHLRYVIEKVSQDPISVKMLKVTGYDVMRILRLPSGPLVGKILEILLQEVLEEPKKNKKEYLEERIKELGKLSLEEISSLAQKAKEEKEKIETKRDEMAKKKYWVM